MDLMLVIQCPVCSCTFERDGIHFSRQFKVVIISMKIFKSTMYKERQILTKELLEIVRFFLSHSESYNYSKHHYLAFQSLTKTKTADEEIFFSILTVVFFILPAFLFLLTWLPNLLDCTFCSQCKRQCSSLLRSVFCLAEKDTEFEEVINSSIRYQINNYKDILTLNN